MSESIKFGDVILYKEKEYVFLVKTAELYYVAQILSKEQTKRISELDDRRACSPFADKYKSNLIYCFVKLSTEEFKDRCAHLKNSARDEGNFFPDERLCTLQKEDLIKIKEEILNPDSPVDIGLKELIANIDIQG